MISKYVHALEYLDLLGRKAQEKKAKVSCANTQMSILENNHN